MNAFVCTACGTQYAPTESAPERCAICDDERQFVPETGQSWITLKRLRQGYRNAFQQLEPSLLGIGTAPSFAIGQRALLVRTPGGNVLWDCISLIDDGTVEIVRALGGLTAIAISHPHFYASMVEWSRAFGDVPVHLHAADREWVMRPDPCVRFWEGRSHTLAGGLTLMHVGGHFAGGTVLHWAAGAEGKGALLAGDILHVVPDARRVSFMRSYPNLIPLPPVEVERIAHVVKPLAFDRLYGAFWDRRVTKHAHEAVQESARRYARWARGDEDAGV